jgi:tripartite-type tricarboxylate transporter receptor subunit TctC
MTQRRVILKGGMVAAALTGFPALAQGSVNRIHVGFPAGGSTDLVARTLAEQLRTRTGSAWVVDSRPGAAGRVVIGTFRDLPSDGTNLLITPAAMVTMYPHTYRKLAYEPLTDLVPVSSTVRYPYALVAGPGLPASVQNIAQYKAWATGKQSSYGSAATGTGLHMAGVILSRALGLDLVHAGYRGGAPMVVDVMGGQIPIGFTVLADVIPGVQAGKMRVLGITGTQRVSQVPDAPTFQEQGIAGLDFLDWQGAFLPKRASTADAEAMNQLVTASLKAPEFIEMARKAGMEPGGESRAAFARAVREDYDRWGPVVKASGFTAED